MFSSQLGVWSSKNVCQDHTLLYLLRSFDFSVVQSDDQEVSANGMSATVNQIDAVLAYFRMEEADLNFLNANEEPAVIERLTQLYCMMFELLKRDDGLIAFSSSSLAQIGLRWLAFLMVNSPRNSKK